MRDEFDPKRFAWARSRFDVEGLAGAIAAWLVGILLGIVWGPLFWIGAVAAVGILLATRRSNRAVPSDPLAVVAPVDGVVQSVSVADVPNELRYRASEAVRIRIASSPASQNRVFSPASGAVASLVQESGTESQPVAMDADAHGLFNAYLTIDTESGPIGVRLVTGGLGPRVDMDLQDGDKVDVGHVIGKRRLGGWCDVFLPEGSAVGVGPGATLVGAETRLIVGDNAVPEQVPDRTAADDASAEVAAPADAEVEASTNASDTKPAAPAEPQAENEDKQSESAPGQATDSEEPSQLETLTAEDGQDPSELFAKLKSRVEEANKT
ncbi:MAG: phosphatidylserine decarboxylase [Pseudomonadota bacterium]